MIVKTDILVFFVEKLLKILVRQCIALLVSSVVFQVFLETVIGEVDIGGSANCKNSTCRLCRCQRKFVSSPLCLGGFRNCHAALPTLGCRIYVFGKAEVFLSTFGSRIKIGSVWTIGNVLCLGDC